MQGVRGRISIGGKVDGRVGGLVLGDRPRRVDGSGNAIGLNREGKLEGVRFLIGKGFGEQICGADLRGLDPPERGSFALAGHHHGLRCTAHRV